MSILNLFHSSQSAQSNLRNLLHLADRAITNNFPTNELQLGQVQEYNAICKATIYLILGIVSEVPYGIHKTRRAFELALATIDNIEDKSIMLKAFEISIMILLYDLYKKENIHQDRLETLVSKLNLSIQEIPDNDFIKKDEITRHICNRNIIGDLCATVASKRSD